MQLFSASCSSLLVTKSYSQLYHAPSSPQDVTPNYDSRTLNLGSRDSSGGVVTRLGSELHEARLAVQSMDNLFYKMPRPTVFQWLCPGGVWLTSFLHVVLKIRMSGAVPPFSIRQADYITLHNVGSYVMKVTVHCSVVGL